MCENYAAVFCPCKKHKTIITTLKCILSDSRCMLNFDIQKNLIHLKFSAMIFIRIKITCNNCSVTKPEIIHRFKVKFTI